MTVAVNVCPELDGTKSPNDKNSYRLVRLPNGIEALLVANPDESKQKAACAVSVQVGSFSDPAGRCEGLAHYCEHMIFLGSQRYPGEAEFEEFLSQNGGYSNAYTECEYTCYYFEVNRRALHKAVDMFAQIFHQPLLNADSSMRELQAIESEFQRTKKSDSSRSETLFASFAKSGHPWKIFGWGNLESLQKETEARGVSLHDELKKFFNEHYKASRMRLCLFGVEGLDSLEELVSKFFAEVPASPGLKDLDFKHCGLPIPSEVLPRLVRVRPVKDAHAMHLSWQLPSQLEQLLLKPEQYIAGLIGDEGHGSALSALKNEGLATELCAGTGSDNFTHSTNCMVFDIEVVLTDKGMREWPRVGKVIFQYLQMLKNFGTDLPPAPFEEARLVSQMSYRFKQEKDPCDLASDLSVQMLPCCHVKAANLLNSGSIYEEFRPDLIKTILDDLSPRKCFLMLLSSAYGRASVASAKDEDGEDEDGSEDGEDEGDDDGDDENDKEKADKETAEKNDAAICLDPHFDPVQAAASMKVEARFGTEYWDCGMDAQILQDWENCGVDERFHVPMPNEFIATEFQILDTSGTPSSEGLRFERTALFADFPVSTEPLWPVPEKLNSAGDLNLWHLMCSQRFKQPRSEVRLCLTSPFFALDPTNIRKDVLLELYVRCLGDSLNETLYPASKARLHGGVGMCGEGLEVSFRGFSQKLLKFAERVLGDLQLKDYCSKSFSRYASQKEQLMRGYKNAWLKPQNHCGQLRRLMLLPLTCRPVQKAKELETVETMHLEDFVGNLFRTLGCDALVVGNALREEVQSWAQNVLVPLFRPVQQPIVDQDVVRLERGKTHVWVEPAEDATTANSALELYVQIPGRDRLEWEEDRTRQKILIDLIEDLMSEPLFDSLRTKQQLGYSVGCQVRDSYGVHGMSFYVLSAVQRPAHLLERVEVFLQEYRETLKTLPAEKLADHARAYASRWLEPRRTMGELNCAHWEEVTCGAPPVWDRRERLAAIAGTVTLAELVEMYDTYIVGKAEDRRCIVTAVVPAKKMADGTSMSAAEAAPEDSAGLQKVAAEFSCSGSAGVSEVKNEVEFRATAQLYPQRSPPPQT
eukprot:TRINITY_DN69436_c0_g1_i1.p1 TRINITY_DN69436_c0_g1~~TRINITY_DN69436_c0_g1_i1.p1  ORF type:complete len:1094 (-),score=297.55 TRINITY_DN69436_c0_g1_i1:265-3546(-)